MSFESGLPTELQTASKKIASDLLAQTVCEIYGSPILAYYSLCTPGGPELTSPFLQRASKWAAEFVSKLPAAAFADVGRKLPYVESEVIRAGDIRKAQLCEALLHIEQVPKNESHTVKATLRKYAADNQIELPKETAMSKPPAGKPAVQSATGTPTSVPPPAPNNPPTQPYTVPREAPPPAGESYTPPGGTGPVSIPGAGAPDETYREQDEAVFPDGTAPTHYSEPGDHTGTPAAPAVSPYPEQDQSTFPGTAPPGSGQTYHTNNGPASAGQQATDLNLCVPPAQQPPETERHQPYLHKEQAAAPKPPWEARMAGGDHAVTPTPGMEHLYQSDDGHLTSIEQCAQEVDLYAARYAKHSRTSDLKAQAERFGSERGCMGTMAECAGHVDEQRTYSKEVFAFSYGQMRRSLNRAIRQFSDTEDEPNLAEYHELLSMRADLLGEASKKHFAQGNIASVFAEFALGTGVYSADKKPGDGADQKKDDKGDDDMKDTDVAEAVKIAYRQAQSGLLQNNEEAFAQRVMTLAKMDLNARKAVMEMMQPAGLDPALGVNAGLQLPNQQTQFDPYRGGQVAQNNLVPTGVVENAGNGQRGQQRPQFGMFNKTEVAPIFG